MDNPTILELENQFNKELADWGATGHLGQSIVGGSKEDQCGLHMTVSYPIKMKLSSRDVLQMMNIMKKYYHPVIRVINHDDMTYSYLGSLHKEIIFVFDEKDEDLGHTDIKAQERKKRHGKKSR